MYAYISPKVKVTANNIPTKMLIPVLIILLSADFIFCENHFMATVRNLTNNSSNNENSKRDGFNNDNVLIDEVKKYLNECKLDTTSEIRHDDNGNTGPYLGHYDIKSNFHNTERRSNRESGNFDDGNIEGFLTNYRNDRTNHRSQNPCTEERRNYYQRSEDNNYENHHSGNRNTNEFDRRGGGNVEGNRNRPHDPSLNYRNSPDYNNHEPAYRRSQNNDEEFSNYDSGIRYPDDRGSGVTLRWRRQSENCISQCIFGYMELLDENNMPSETATIKYLQDHMQNDRKRIKLVRDTRRCFAKLATTEHDDGCEFSKTLAKCLKLNLE